jgi:F1F0 ATPase subunit 2
MEIIINIMVFVTGIALGTLFFGGLWITVKIAVSSKIPAMWFFVSLCLRICITLLVFYYISQGSLQRLLLCVCGFVAARFMVVYYTKLIDDKRVRINHEA